MWPYNPTIIKMWFGLFPLSLATTNGISVDFFSSRYLDVSVHAVVFFTLYIQIKIHELHSCGFAHSEILGSMLGWQLPEAYSSLLLPSSTSDAYGIHQMPFSIIYKSLNSISLDFKTQIVSYVLFQRSQIFLLNSCSYCTDMRVFCK